MPTPVKYYDPQVRQSYAKVEEAATEKMLDALPPEMKAHYQGLMKGDSEEDLLLHRYVKAADKISALIKCIEEEQMGNRDFIRAKEATQKIIDGLDMPEVKFFMEHFMPGYYRTLDEQTLR